MSIYNVREFAEKCNKSKVRGMDCTREELLQDKNLELAYICGCLMILLMFSVINLTKIFHNFEKRKTDFAIFI